MNEKYTLEARVNGKNINKISHGGKFFIEAKDGTEYTLRVSNNTSKRVMAIITVDGVNVVDGTEAAGDGSGTGYIIQPYSATEIKGFRESTTHVGAFKFTAKNKSYTKEVVTGTPTNCGVIGCLIVAEKEDIRYKKLLEHIEELKNRPKEKEYISYPVPAVPIWPRPRDYWYEPVWFSSVGDNVSMRVPVSMGVPDYSYNAQVMHRNIGGGGTQSSMGDTLRSYDTGAESYSGAPVTAYYNQVVEQKDAEPEFDLGSTWGQRVFDKVEMVEFDRGNIIDTSVVYYASRDVLEAMGVPVIVKKAVSFPDPFPSQFCKPPKHFQ